MALLRQRAVACLAVLALCATAAQGFTAVTTDFTFGMDKLFPADFFCPDLSVTNFGISNDGKQDVSTALKDRFGYLPGNYDSYLVEKEEAHIMFLPKGTYRIAKDIRIVKTIQAAEGAKFLVDKGVTLTLDAPINHPPSVFFTGEGTVKIDYSLTPSAYVEWWGAKGDGTTNDFPAIQRALQTYSGVLKFRAGKVYGVKNSLVKTETAYIMAEAGAKLKALRTGLTGLQYVRVNQDHQGIDQLPDFVGFDKAIQASATSRMVIRNIEDCNDAFFLFHQGNDFGIFAEVETIKNVGRAVVFNVANYKPEFFMQGTSIVVDKFQDTVGNKAKALVHFQGPNSASWDSNSFTFGAVEVANSPGFAVLRCDGSVCNWKDERGIARINVEVKSLSALAGGSKVIDGTFFPNNNLKIQFTQPPAVGMLDDGAYRNNLLYTASSGVPTYTLTQAQGVANFNGGYPAYTSLSKARLPPWDGLWRKGELRTYYFYHQLVQKYKKPGSELTAQFYIAEPRYGGQCMPNGVVLTAVMEHAQATDRFGNVEEFPFEIIIQALPCWDIVYQNHEFQLMVGTVGTF